jgi:DNA-binding NarL/FixJ family response regulator
MKSEVKVLLADDSEAICRAIRAVLHLEPRIEISRETRTLAETVEAASILHPNVILLDLHLPAGDIGFEPSTARVRLLTHCDRVIAMSIANDWETKELAAQFGAVVLLDKTDLATNLIPALLPLPFTIRKTRDAE